VRGHAGHPFNERCDKLAKRAVAEGVQAAEQLEVAPVNDAAVTAEDERFDGRPPAVDKCQELDVVEPGVAIAANVDATSCESATSVAVGVQALFAFAVEDEPFEAAVEEDESNPETEEGDGFEAEGQLSLY
ncbi:MAG: hypothetical protein J7K75_01040, partial [Desulfuromonas sp.]|nr:hypothetical protein [Desulfuromonas sp.]